MEDQNQSEKIYRFKWFMSLSRKPNTKSDELKSHHSSTSISGVFLTLRKRFQKKMTSIKIKAYEPDRISGTNIHHAESDRLPAYVSNHRSDDNFARLVTERYSQNPIRFSPPSFTALSSRDSSSMIPQNAIKEGISAGSTASGSTNINFMMEKVREDLLKYGWYWGKLSRSAAQKRLTRQDNGTFLVRDSETEKDQFAVSFRSSGITLHCRIDHIDNFWTFSGLTTSTQYETITDLIEDSMRKSGFDVIGFGKQTSPLTPPFPVRLKKPINRFYEVSSLQHMCRFIIRQRMHTNDITRLPLPSKLKDYIEANFYDF